MLKIYGNFFSPPVNKVRLCASYLGLPHDYNHVDLVKGEQQSPEFLAINPAGRVPAIDDDGFTLSESDAICKYMCALSGPSKFYPADAQEQALVNQWIDYSSQHIFRQGVIPVYFNRVVAPLFKVDTNEASIKAGLATLERDLPLVETVLKERDFLTNDHITLADISLIAALEPAEMSEIDLSAYPAIIKWRTGIMQKDFYTKVHSHFGAEMTAG